MQILIILGSIIFVGLIIVGILLRGDKKSEQLPLMSLPLEEPKMDQVVKTLPPKKLFKIEEPTVEVVVPTTTIGKEVSKKSIFSRLRFGSKKEKKLDLPKESKSPSFLKKIFSRVPRQKEIKEIKPSSFSQPSASQPHFDIQVFLDKTKIKDIMTPKVYSIRVDQSFSLVPRILDEYSVRHLPVVDINQKVVGMITQREMYKIRSPRKLIDGEWHYDDEMLNDIILQHVMIKDPFTLHPEDSLGRVLLKMVHTRIGGIPIVDEYNVLCGIITRRDMLRLIANFYSNT